MAVVVVVGGMNGRTVCCGCREPRAYLTSLVVYQMLEWWTKKMAHSVNISDAAGNMVPMCSVYNVSSNGCISKILVRFRQNLTYLLKLFILKLVCTATASLLKNK